MANDTNDENVKSYMLNKFISDGLGFKINAIAVNFCSDGIKNEYLIFDSQGVKDNSFTNEVKKGKGSERKITKLDYLFSPLISCSMGYPIVNITIDTIMKSYTALMNA